MMRMFIVVMFMHLLTPAVAQQKIVSELTAQHQQFAGLNVSLVPPAGFTRAVNFTGFQQEESASSIVIMSLPAPFMELSEGFTKENLKGRDMELLARQELLINEMPGVLLTATQEAHGRIYKKYMLVFGIETGTVLINASFPQELEATGSNILASLLTAYYDRGKKNNPLEIVDFSIIVPAEWKLSDLMAESLVYTRDGKLPPATADKTTFIANKSFPGEKIIGKRQFAIDRLKSTPFEIISQEPPKAIKIAGLEGYEIEAIGTSDRPGEKETIYMAILFMENAYYVFLGTTNMDAANTIGHFRSAVRSFKRK
ncbi:MAG: hypothetical protein EOO04_30860 [Chitinophagaceae bacterium]|nr:MAG: hypothetical protein EOO04_30860 [Chitinophagaceae bacterium]